MALWDRHSMSALVPLSLTFLQEQGGWVWPVDEGEADGTTAAVSAELAKSN